MHGTENDAFALREEIAGVLAPTGQRLSAAKTSVRHVRDGFDFPGFRIQWRRKPGTSKWYVCTFIANRPGEPRISERRILVNRGCGRNEWAFRAGGNGLADPAAPSAVPGRQLPDRRLLWRLGCMTPVEQEMLYITAAKAARPGNSASRSMRETVPDDQTGTRARSEKGETIVSSAADNTLGPDDPVVVVGAGIVGCSAAFHLLRSGARQVTLVDAIAPGAGTTPASAGFVALWAAGEFPLGRSGIELERYGLEFYRELATSGAEIGYRSNGNLVLALTDDGAGGRPTGILSHSEASPGTRWLSREEVCARASVIAPDAIAGGALMPSGIQVNAGPAVQAIKQLVRSAGGTIVEEAPVEGFGTAQGKVRSVKTPAGDIDAAGVVIAAGAWTNQILDHLDRWLPLVRVVATRVVTGDVGVPDTLPTVQCPEAGLWIREMGGAFTWGTVAGYEPAYLFEQTEGTLGWGRPRSERLLGQVLDTQPAISKIFPPLRDAAVDSWIQGIVTYTADQRFLIGHVSGFDNAVVATGDNESGVSHGPGMGRAAAELVRGEPPFVDVGSFRPHRFVAADLPTEEAVARRLAATHGWIVGAGSG